jgi:hypothetical protein
VSIMEFGNGKVIHKTQYFGDPFEARGGVPNGWNKSEEGKNLCARSTISSTAEV